ncbi:MAG: MBL fold metallo-hydrolase, partial [Peptococcales bacterium]
MEKLIVLGTGHAMVTKCYNTCFAICRGNEYFLIDAGGGNGVLSRFEELGLNWSKLHNIFITHEHTDHLLGLFWVIRKMAGQIHSGKYEGNLYIYCHLDLVETIKTICQLTMSERIIHLLGKRIILVPVQNGDIKEIIQSQITFFDL